MVGSQAKITVSCNHRNTKGKTLKITFHAPTLSRSFSEFSLVLNTERFRDFFKASNLETRKWNYQEGNTEEENNGYVVITYVSHHVSMKLLFLTPTVKYLIKDDAIVHFLPHSSQ